MALNKIYTDNTVIKKSNGGTLAWVATKPYNELFGEDEFDLSILLNNSSTSKMLNNGAYGGKPTKYNSANVVASGENTTPIQFLGCFLSTTDSYNIAYGINITQKITMEQENIGGDSWQQFIDNFRFIVDFVSADGVSYQNYQDFDYYNTTKTKYGFSSTYLVFNALYNTSNVQLFNRSETSNPESITGDNSKRFLRASLNVITTNYNKFMGQYDSLTKEYLATLWYAFRVNGDLIIIREPDYITPSSDYNKVRFLLSDNSEEYLTIGGFSDSVEDGTTGGLPNNDDTKGLFVGQFAVSGQFRQCNFYYSTNNAIMHNANSTGIRWTVNDITTAKNFRDYVRLGVMDANGLITHNEWLQGENGITNSDNPNKNGNYSELPEWDFSGGGGDNDDIESVGYGYFSNAVMGTLYSLYNKLDLEKIAQWFYNQTEKIDIANNVISLKEIPFSLSTLNIAPLDTDLKIGGVNVTYNNENIKVGQIVSPATTTVSVLFGEFNIPRLSGTFLDYSPYTKYELLLPFAPTPVTLPDWCVNKTVSAIFLYDIYTTACQYVIECNGERICSVSGIFGVDRPISAQNVALKDASRLSAQVATASSVLGGVMSSASGNIGGIVSGAIGGVSALSQMIMSGKQNYMYTVGANGDSSSVGLCHAVHLKITRTLSAEDSNFTHVYGRPLCKYKKLSLVTGYTKCDNVNTNGLSCSEIEKQRIKQLLETGIYI